MSWENINHWRARSSVEGIAALKLSDRVVCGWRTDLTFRITNLAHLENLTRSFKSVEWGDPCLRFWLWNARVPQIARLHLAELCFAQQLGWGSNIKIYASDSSLCWQPPLFLKVSWGWAANFFCQTFWKVVETKLPQLNVTKTQPFLWTFTNPKKSFKNCIFIKAFPDQETVLSSRRCPRLPDWGAQLWNFPPGR